MNKASNRFNEVPEWLISKWQEIVNLLAEIINVPAALLMKIENEYMEVFVSNKSNGNPYNVGDKEKWHGLYCETVIKSQKKLLIPNALKDKNWDSNPDIKLGMISYFGFPINFPDRVPFGTICVLDNKGNSFNKVHEQLIIKFKDIIENDLLQLELFSTKQEKLNKRITSQNEELLKKNC